LKESAKHAGGCNQGTSKKQLANGVSVSDQKAIEFHHQFKHDHQKLTTRQPTNFSMKNQSFILTARVTAEQFKQHTVRNHVLIKLTIFTTFSKRDISEF